MFILLGLGNPGPKYLLTRHNVGFRVVDCLSRAEKIPLYKVGYQSFWGKGSIAGQDVVLAKPMTYMNNSGLAGLALCRQFRVPAERLLVIYDDLDLPFGVIRLRPQGGSGGHNGLKSLTYHLQSDRFPRMRIGIGRPGGGDAADYVLEPFTPQEETGLDPVLAAAAGAARLFIEEGIHAAMNRFNAPKNKALLPDENVVD